MEAVRSLSSDPTALQNILPFMGIYTKHYNTEQTGHQINCCFALMDEKIDCLWRNLTTGMS